MTERRDLLVSIAGTISDFRSKPTPDHVDCWISQFDQSVQIPMLRELKHVFSTTYLGRRFFVERFLAKVVVSNKLAGADPRTFWSRAKFLNIQNQSQSQGEMLSLFDEVMYKTYKQRIADCGKSPFHFIYLDDGLFSGGRVKQDLSKWIKTSAPAKAIIHIVLAVSHKHGEHDAKSKLEAVIVSTRKKIEIDYRALLNVEDRPAYKNNSDVLWPSEVPNNTAVQEYFVQHRNQIGLRPSGGSHGPFSGEAGRQLLEREFLKAGVKIRGLGENTQEYNRPLGRSWSGFGFGAMTVTYRNCPNNCPLALWWGDPAHKKGPLAWYPLFPRIPNAAISDTRPKIMEDVLCDFAFDECSDELAILEDRDAGSRL